MVSVPSDFSYQKAEKPVFARAAQKGPDVPRLRGTARDAGREAYLVRTPQRRASATTPQMGLFQQPVKVFRKESTT
jgi:hypothetical protein